MARWECADMLRKLLLVGLLTIVDQGSTVQVCAGLATSFVCFAAHVYTLPYRHTEDNLLKGLSDHTMYFI